MSDNKKAKAARLWLFELRDKAIADGEDGKAAAIEYVDFVTMAVSELTHLCTASPGRFRKIAGSLDRWPTIHFAHPEDRKSSELALAKLRLGEKSEMNFDGKAFSRQTPANDIVLRVHGFISEMRRPDQLPYVLTKVLALWSGNAGDAVSLENWRREVLPNLPALERETAAEWHKRSWQVFLFLFGEDFDSRPEFKSWARVKERWARRDAIKKAIKQAWRTVARDSG